MNSVTLSTNQEYMDVSLGVDLVEYASFRKTENNARFMRRVYTQGERAYCESKQDSLPFFAARFAAKEAVIKAFGQQGISLQFSDIEIVRSANGSVSAVVAIQPSFHIHLSFAHGRESAVAVAMVRRIATGA